MVIEDYLKYLNKSLGLKEVLLPAASVEEENLAEESVEEITPETNSLIQTRSWDSPLNKELTPLLSLHLKWESGVIPENSYSAFFVRVTAQDLSLADHPSVLELFEKLRQALGLHKNSAPYIEITSEQESEVLNLLRLQAPRLLVMKEEELWKGASLDTPWIIPDPFVLAEKTELKRPTWDLLKEWIKL